jgi:hypothetical protein
MTGVWELVHISDFDKVLKLLGRFELSLGFV